MVPNKYLIDANDYIYNRKIYVNGKSLSKPQMILSKESTNKVRTNYNKH